MSPLTRAAMQSTLLFPSGRSVVAAEPKGSHWAHKVFHPQAPPSRDVSLEGIWFRLKDDKDLEASGKERT